MTLVSPEYSRSLNELDSLVASLPNQFPDDIEYSRAGCRLPLHAEGMEWHTYYTVTKSLPYPYLDNPDWSVIPAKLGRVTDWGDGGGFVTHYETRQGLLMALSYPYENNVFLDEEISERELSSTEIQKIIEELSAAQPIHPDQVQYQQITKSAKLRAFIRRWLRKK